MSKGLGEQLTYSGSSLDARETIILQEGQTVDGVITNISNAYPGLKVKVIERLEKSDFTGELTSSKIYEIKKTSNRNKPLPVNQGGYELIKEPRDLKYSDGTSFLNENGNINSDTKLIEISNKIDKLPSGIYYGQYSSVENLPAISTLEQKGYAYVSSVEPNVYYIYLYNGDGEEWQDSGNKFVTTELETNLSTKSQTKAPTTKAVKEGIEAVDVTLERSVEDENELTKAQKYNASANINDRVADVVPVTNEVKALGYKVLKAYDPNNPNTTTFQAQVTEPNTIYEIKSFFSLGERLEIPVSGDSLSSGIKVLTHTASKKLYTGQTVTIDGGFILNSTRTEVLGEESYTNVDEETAYISYFLAVPYDKGSGTYAYDVDGDADDIRLNTEKEVGVVGYYLSADVQVLAGETISILSPNSVCFNQSGNAILSDGIGNYTATTDGYIKFGQTQQAGSVEYVKCQMITLPNNSTLMFNGGKIDNGVVILNDCKIEGTESCFSNGMKFLGKTASTMFADVWDDAEDADKIERAIRYFSSVSLHSRTYTITRPIVVSNNFTLLGKSQGDFFGEHYGNVIDGKGCQLKAVGGIDCIIDVRGKYAPKDDENHPIHERVVPGAYASYISARINGVSFVSSRNTDAIWWSTPGGPSRPVIIENCTFASLINGLHVWGSTKIYSTNMGDVLIQGCDFHGNVWGINADGNHCVGNFNISSCLMEANHNHNYTDGGGIKINGLMGTLRVSLVELEGQPYGVNIIGSNMNVIIENNYFEYHKGQKNIIVGNGVDRSRVYISTTGVTHQDKVEWDIRNCIVEFAQGHGATFSNKYLFERSLITTPLNGRVVGAKGAITPYDIQNIDYVEDITFPFASTMSVGVAAKDSINYIMDGYPIFINTPDGTGTPYRQLNINFQKDAEYILSFYMLNSSTTNALASSGLGLSYGFPVSKGELCLFNYRFKPLEIFPLYKTDEENGIGLAKNQTITVTAIEGVTLCLLKSITNSDGYEVVTSNSADTSTNLQYTASAATTLYIAVAITSSDDENKTVNYEITEVQEQETVVVSSGSVNATDVVFSHSKSISINFRHSAGTLIVSRPVIIKNTTDSKKFLGYPLNYAEMYGYKENITNVPVGYRWPEGDYCAYNGTKWIDQNGFTYAAKAGTSAERPVLASTDAGYPYFDTTLGKPIYWNSVAWVDGNGILLSEIQVSNKSVLLQASASSNTVEVYTNDEPTAAPYNPDDTPATWLSATLSGTTLTISATANTILVAPEFGDDTYFSESGGTYTQLLTEPANWDTNYADYYTEEDGVYSSVEGVVAPATNPRGGKVVLTNTTDEVVINVIQNYV